jgi:hypothetical protein
MIVIFQADFNGARPISALDLCQSLISCRTLLGMSRNSALAFIKV